jgi:hypothetical protein
MAVSEIHLVLLDVVSLADCHEVAFVDMACLPFGELLPLSSPGPGLVRGSD